MLYLWVKTFHVLFVIAWMAAVFYLPRILVNIAETAGKPEVQAHLVLMGRRLYRFGHIMFGLAVVCGLLMWFGWKLSPALLPRLFVPGPWLHAKLALVALMLVYYVLSGRWLKGLDKGRVLPSGRTLRLFNEAPVLLLLGVLWLVILKPAF